MTHVDLQDALPDYLAGRLADSARQDVEQHLKLCSECADLIADWQPMVPTLRKHGAAIFEPHPEPSRLRLLAQGGGAKDADAAAHCASCPSCALEVEAWRGAVVGQFGRSTGARPAGGIRAAVWWGVAATVAASALLVVAWRGNPLTSPPAVAIEWSGAPRMLVLEGGERGDGAQPRLELEAGQPYALLGAQPSLPGSIAEHQSVRFSLVRRDGREVWGVGLSAGQIRERLRKEGAVTLLVPRHVLPAGAASLRALSDGERFWEVAFEIGPQRQSPDATKAPQ